MKKVIKRPYQKWKAIVWTILAVLFVILVLLPLSFSAWQGEKSGNVALIPINGVITAEGEKALGQSTISSTTLVHFMEEADKNSQIKVILLEINSPGGSAVASDEIATAAKRVQKPVVALIREVGGSGGYWVASAADYVIANRMSITGSIGVISSYLEFSGLMQKYGVNYERLVSGEHKDIGSPYKPLDPTEQGILQDKMNKIHNFFVEEIAQNRHMDKKAVERLATGEFFLGIEALNLGLVDQLGDRTTAEEYIKQAYGLEKIEYVPYERKIGFFELFAGVFSDFSFNLGKGMGSILLEKDLRLWLM